MKEFDISENDYVFFTPVGEDEGMLVHWHQF
jgi:hypothetical protein